MAKCKLSPHDFIKSSFTPQIGVICSSSVDQICKKNNLNFIELVQPFCKLGCDLYLQDPNGGVTTVHHLKITLMDVNFKYPQPTAARKFLSNAVSQASDPRSHTIQIGEYMLNIPTSTPWFEAWRDTFLQVQIPSDHEFTKHYIACILVVSSFEKDPIDSMILLNQRLNEIQILSRKYPKGFGVNALRYYVIIHDNLEGDAEKATYSLDGIKVLYGLSNCFLLKINSRQLGQGDEQLPDPWSQYISHKFESDCSTSSPDISPNVSRAFVNYVVIKPDLTDVENVPYHPLSPTTDIQNTDEQFDKEMQTPSPCNTTHGMYLTTEDVEQIKLFIHEFCTRSLIPYVEKQLQILTESISNKKNVSKSLFSATKRWFTPSKMGATNGAANMPTYTMDAPEMQIRKLGDLFFMFCHYNMAFHSYHAAKKDFSAEQAWLHYAGALEMAALSAFMMNESSKKTCDYIEESIVTYLNVCKMTHFATRATLMSLECLKGRNLQSDASHQLIRMTNEESDLRSALLLEQTAYCFLSSSRPQMVRKYAFHMVLAGHRFTKAAQKRHALRCYKQALQIFHGKNWTFAEDHIHFTIGKLSSNLNLYKEAADAFSKLITIQNKQTIEQQAMYLKEYLSSQHVLLSKISTIEHPTLLLPTIDSKSIKILVGPTPPLSIPGKVRASDIALSTNDSDEIKQKWNKLEEMLVHEAQGSLPLIFKPVITLYTKDNINNSNFIAIAKEPIQVSMKLFNPLSIALNLRNIYLYWSFKGKNSDILSNQTSCIEVDKFVKTNIIKSLFIASGNSQDLILSVVPLTIGELSLKGIFYNLTNEDSGGEQNLVHGKQLFDVYKSGQIKKDESNDIVTKNLEIPITIMPPAPCLQVTFSEINSNMLCNQIQPILVEMRNVGSESLHKIYTATSVPHLLSTCEFHRKSYNYKVGVDLDAIAVKEREARKNHISHIPLPNETLEPGCSHTVKIWIKIPDEKGPLLIDLLMYYENTNSLSVPRYRLIRHEWNLVASKTLDMNVVVTEGHKSDGVKEMLLSLEVINTNKHHNMLTQISLLKIGLLSSCWKLAVLENFVYNTDIIIKSQQSTNILLRAQRCNTKYNHYYDSVLTNKCAVTPINSAYLDFAKRIEFSGHNIFETNKQTKNENEGIVFVNWNANILNNIELQQTVSGQNHFVLKTIKNEEETVDVDYQAPLVLYDSTRSIETESIETENGITDELRTQISMSIIHISDVFHNFNKNKLCVIPVKIALHNDTSLSSEVKLNTLGTNSASAPPLSKSGLFYPYPSKDFRWVGFSSTNKVVAPLSSEIVTLYAAVTSPGVYDLGRRLEHWCQNSLYNEPVLQTYRALCFVTVSHIE